jgi:hypothetical protein|tara:strand:+ start:233 stop:664 length:432 start_codon:yes stop_codon:yes gene_type:complete
VRRAVLVITLFLATNIFAEPNLAPTGLWNTFDEDGSLLSTVEVKIEDAKLYANIIAVHTPGDKNPMCEQCKGDLYGKPVIGMEIINGLTLKKNVWQKGSVFDPKIGDSFKGKVWLEDGKLLVRGYVGFLYQTQYWEKALNTDQ